MVKKVLRNSVIIVVLVLLVVQAFSFATDRMIALRYHPVFGSMIEDLRDAYVMVRETIATTNLAALYEAAINPNMKYIAVIEGMRKEEMANVYQKALGWNEAEKEEFAQALGCYMNETADEGYLYPSAYVVPKGSNPEDVKELMKAKFDKVIEPLIGNATSSVVNLDTAVTIASIIQREAAGKRDMKLISGIIWNRLFQGMTLDIDATLQYVKGDSDKWWPKVKSEDKYLESPYNTYQNKGLPPTAISNPGVAAIDAALNPEKTNCIFYIHDKNRRIHCAKTYAEHKRNVDIYLK